MQIIAAMFVDTAALVLREHALDAVKAERFAQMLRDGSRPPPIQVMRYDAKRWFLYDGHHRVGAARLAGASRLRAEVITLD
jgi:ParB-like nuclease domain